MREKKVEAYLGRGIKAMGGIYYKFSSPNRRFVTDRLVVLPHGIVVFVECKSPTGRLHPGQIRELVRLEGLGQRTEVLSTIEEVDGFLDRMNQLMRVMSNAL